MNTNAGDHTGLRAVAATEACDSKLDIGERLADSPGPAMHYANEIDGPETLILPNGESTWGDLARRQILAIVDGISRKIIAMRGYAKRPTSADLSKLVETSIGSSGVGPRFLITDHGSQFRGRFHGSVELLGVTHIRCQVRTWQLNSKVERGFRDVKGWAARSAMPLRVGAVQRRLNAYRVWHNRFRPHTAMVP